MVAPSRRVITHLCCGLPAPANAKVMLALLLRLLLLLLLLLLLSSPSKGRSVSWALCGRDAANADVMLHSPALSDGRPRRHQIGCRTNISPAAKQREQELNF